MIEKHPFLYETGVLIFIRKVPIFYDFRTFRLLFAFSNSNGHSHSRTDHWVVAHAEESHHFHMGGHGAGASKLSVGVHPAHGVSHTVGGRAGCHIVRVQGAARTTAGGHGEILLALLNAFLLIRTGHRMLEPGGVGGITGDGHIHALVVHDGHALPDVIRAVAADCGPLAFRIFDLPDDLQFAGIVIKLRLDIGEAIDAADDLRRPCQVR